MKKTVDIWTDGACSGNPGKGGWCSILIYNGTQKIISGNEQLTTNNRMELMAVIQALNALREPCIVNLHSDSAYIINAINNNWLEKWSKNGWINSKKQTVANQELWEELIAHTKIHNIKFIKVAGHSQIELNELCDKYARQEIKKIN